MGVLLFTNDNLANFSPGMTHTDNRFGDEEMCFADRRKKRQGMPTEGFTF